MTDGGGAAEPAAGLLVYVPSLHTRQVDPGPLLQRLRADLPGWRVECWDHGIKPWSTVGMADVAWRLAVQVRTWAGDNGVGSPVGRIVLVGHSIGGLLVRHAYLLDADAVGGDGSKAQPWTAKVQRIALLAAPNAGFVRTRLKPWLRPLYAAAAATRRLTVEDLQHGSPYITELRLRWLHAFRGSTDRPSVVQVLGDRDDVVTRDDSLDVEWMPKSTRVDVPGATHGSVVDVGVPGRYELLRHALFDPLREGAEEEPPSGTSVFMLLHGIRTSANAHWLSQLSQALTATDPTAELVVPTYGYLSAVEFALPFARTRNLREFLDWYGRMYLEHGDPPSFAGHSNGTYLLGRALLEVPAMRFARIYLAGSVLPREYPWTTVAARGQVTERVHHDRANKDIPVGWLCSALRGLGRDDLGTAGLDGFDERGRGMVTGHENPYHGGHGEALSPDHIPHVAGFLLHGDLLPDPEGKPAWWFGATSRVLRVSALPLVATAAYRTARWVAADDDTSRLRAVGIAGAVAWAVGRSA